MFLYYMENVHKQKKKDTFVLFDMLSSSSAFSALQSRKIIELINEIRDENYEIYATKKDLAEIELRLVKKILSGVGLIVSIAASVLKMML